MRCAQHTGNSNHYLACRGTKPQEAIDYLFDMLLKPRSQEKKKRWDKDRKKKDERLGYIRRKLDDYQHLCVFKKIRHEKLTLVKDYCNFRLL